MSYISPEGIVIPAGGDSYNLTTDLRTQASSTRSVVSTADRAGGDSVASAMNTDGRPVSASNPLVIFNQATRALEWKDNVGWNGVSAMHAEYTGPAFATTAGAGVSFGGPSVVAFSVDTAKTINNTFVQPDTGGRVKILEAGLYALSAIILPTSVPGSYTLSINDVTGASVVLASFGGVGYGNKEESICAPNVYLPANTIVEFDLATSNAVTLGSRVKITKNKGV